ncbi:MAG: hypothetical protein Kow0029_06670 [Candidatus Rifleibacteriota bacterium]
MTKKCKAGLGFVEVLIAVIVISACAIPIIYMVTGARADTSKAINYLRAMELANEAIEWASVTPFENVTEATMAAFSGPITEDVGGALQSAKIAVDSPENKVWENDNFTVSSLKYSQQYDKAFFYREIQVEDISDSYVAANLLKKVTVKVKWSEGYRPANINLPDDRSRQVQLSILLLNDQNLSY